MTKSKLDILADDIARDFAHIATSDAIRRRSTLEFESGQLDNSISSLKSQLADATARRGEVDAMVTGLKRVIARR